jgi:hypothetical protein
MRKSHILATIREHSQQSANAFVLGFFLAVAPAVGFPNLAND